MLNDKYIINIRVLPQLEPVGEHSWMHHLQSDIQREPHSDHITVNCLFTGSGSFLKSFILKLLCYTTARSPGSELYTY